MQHIDSDGIKALQLVCLGLKHWSAVSAEGCAGLDTLVVEKADVFLRLIPLLPAVSADLLSPTWF